MAQHTILTPSQASAPSDTAFVLLFAVSGLTQLAMRERGRWARRSSPIRHSRASSTPPFIPISTVNTRLTASSYPCSQPQRQLHRRYRCAGTGQGARDQLHAQGALVRHLARSPLLSIPIDIVLVHSLPPDTCVVYLCHTVLVSTTAPTVSRSGRRVLGWRAQSLISRPGASASGRCE